MKNPFAKPKCVHGVKIGGRCHGGCDYWSEGPENWVWDRHGMMNIAPILIFAGAVIAGVAATVAVATTAYSRNNCHRYEDISGQNTDWSLVGGCLVETDKGHWVSLDAYKYQLNLDVR